MVRRIYFQKEFADVTIDSWRRYISSDLIQAVPSMEMDLFRFIPTKIFRTLPSNSTKINMFSSHFWLHIYSIWTY